MHSARRVSDMSPELPLWLVRELLHSEPRPVLLATADHVALRQLINAGYVNAVDQVGAGLTPTWSSGLIVLPPTITLDHVLIDGRCHVDMVDIMDIPSTDHGAVVAQFVVPK